MWINKKYNALKDEYIKSLEKQVDAFKELYETIRKYIDELKMENILLKSENEKIKRKRKPSVYIYEGDYPWAICPECGGSINIETSNAQDHIQSGEVIYCVHCGQALKQG